MRRLGVGDAVADAVVRRQELLFEARVNELDVRRRRRRGRRRRRLHQRRHRRRRRAVFVRARSTLAFTLLPAENG